MRHTFSHTRALSLPHPPTKLTVLVKTPHEPEGGAPGCVVTASTVLLLQYTLPSGQLAPPRSSRSGAQTRAHFVGASMIVSCGRISGHHW